MPRLLWMVGLCVCCVGCPQSKPVDPPSTPSISEAERPPLRILVMGNRELIEAIARRWKSFSEQRLDVQSIDVDQLMSSDSIKADIVIAESRCLPSLAERGWISPLPKQMVDVVAHSTTSKLHQNEWPLVWRQTASYGQRLWGIPLGVPMVAIVEHTPSRPDELPTWAERMVEGDSSSRDTDSIDDSPNKVPDTFLLDRFLSIAASMNPRPDESGFFFNINSAQARLTESWLVEAATLFGQLYRKRVDLASLPPEVAWESVADKKSHWDLAWPPLRGDSSLSVHAPVPWVDSGRGLVASCAKMNRQSAVSKIFLNWLDEDTQRQEFSAYSSAIQPLPERWPTVSDRIDVNRYRELMRRAFDDRFVVHELQFAESFPYRQRLVEALQRIVNDPKSAKTEFEQCTADWDRFTATTGREIQKRRLAKCFDLEAYRE